RLLREAQARRHGQGAQRLRRDLPHPRRSPLRRLGEHRGRHERPGGNGRIARLPPPNEREVLPMSDGSRIEWTDATWNPVRGCTQISPGCAHCYAETFAERFRGVPGHSYEQGFDLTLRPERVEQPLTWKKP